MIGFIGIYFFLVGAFFIRIALFDPYSSTSDVIFSMALGASTCFASIFLFTYTRIARIIMIAVMAIHTLIWGYIGTGALIVDIINPTPDYPYAKSESIVTIGVSLLGAFSISFMLRRKVAAMFRNTILKHERDGGNPG